MSSYVRFKFCSPSISEGMSFHNVWRHFSPEMHKNFHSGTSTRASSPWISRQHWWWSSMWSPDRASEVCWIWPRFCSGRSFSVLNWTSVIQRVLHRSHLSDSFFPVILWIQTLVGNVCEFTCNILLWSCDLTEVRFIHSLSNSLPSPSRRNQSAVNIDVIGPVRWVMNDPSSLVLLFTTCVPCATFPLPFRMFGKLGFPLLSVTFCCGPLGSTLSVWWYVSPFFIEWTSTMLFQFDQWGCRLRLYLFL